MGSKLERSIKRITAREKRVTELEAALKSRVEHLAEMEKLYSKRTELVGDGSGSGSLSLRDIVGGNKITADEQATLEEVEERIESAEAQLEFRDMKIAEIRKACQSDGRDAEEEFNVAKEVGSIGEAQQWLVTLFEMVGEHKNREELAMKDATLAEAKVEELTRRLNHSQSQLQLLRL